MIICYTVPGIWCVTDIIISHFRPFFALLPPTAPKMKFYIYIYIYIHMKKQPGVIIILHKYTNNYDQMMCNSWDMVCNRCNCYFSFWVIFCTFTPLKAKKIKILKKFKKWVEISSFYKCVPKNMIRWCMVHEMWCMTDVIVIFHFGLFFALLLP